MGDFGCNSFFSQFNDKYETYVKKEKESSSGTPRGGTYFAFILREVFENSPALLDVLLGMKKNKKEKIKFDKDKMKLSLEEPFEGENRNRRVDLYIEDDANHSVDIEIKWDDRFHDTQPNDYLDRLHKKGTKHTFILLTKNRDVWSEDEENCLTDDDKEEIENYHVLLSKFYEEIQKYFEGLCKKNNIEKYAKEIGVIKLFLEFLEENIMSYKEKINGTALVKFMEAGCGWRHDDGMNAKKQPGLLFSMPELLYTLMNNINIIAIENVYRDFGKYFTQKGFDNFVCLSKIPSEIDNEEYIGCKCWDKNRICSDGGDFIVYHRFPLRKANSEYNNTPYLIIGVKFSFDYKNKSDGVDVFSYVRYREFSFEKNICKIMEKGEELSEISFIPQENFYNKMKDDIRKALKKAGISL